ncbi:MAG: CAP domain-containing protein [Myxococcota bacterium]
MRYAFAGLAVSGWVLVACSGDDRPAAWDDDDGGGGTGANRLMVGGVGAGDPSGGSGGSASSGGGGVSSGTGGPTGCTATGLALIDAINVYRGQNGLEPIPTSGALCTVAENHVDDLRNHAPHTEAGCNLHSWSDQGSWGGCCYTPDHAQASCMWDKPRELTDYASDGFEISYGGSDDPVRAVDAWSNSSGHNAVILNLGTWANQTWRAVGAAQHDGFAHVWFGTTPD